MRYKKRQGFMLADVIIGLAIVAVLAGVLAALANRQNQAATRLADSRSAARLAERTLCALQNGQPLPAASEAGSVKVALVAQAAAVGNMVWVEVDAQVARQHSVLLGLAPKLAAGNGGGGQ